MQAVREFTLKRLKKNRLYFIVIVLLFLIPTIILTFFQTANAVVLSNMYFSLMGFMVVAFLVDLGIAQAKVELRECLQLGYNRRTFIISRIITIVFYAVLLALILTPMSKLVNDIGLVFEPDGGIDRLLLISYASFFGTIYGYANLFTLTIITALAYLSLSLFALFICLVFINPSPKRYLHLLLAGIGVSFVFWIIDIISKKAGNIDFVDKILGFNKIPNEINLAYPIIFFSTFILAFGIVSYYYVRSIEL